MLATGVHVGHQEQKKGPHFPCVVHEGWTRRRVAVVVRRLVQLSSSGCVRQVQGDRPNKGGFANGNEWVKRLGDFGFQVCGSSCSRRVIAVFHLITQKTKKRINSPQTCFEGSSEGPGKNHGCGSRFSQDP